jgi:glyoxylate reductase
MAKIIVTGKLFPEVLARLEAEGTVVSWQQEGRMPQERLLEEVVDADGLLCTGAPVNEAVLAVAPKLKVVANTMVGYDNIDVPACTAKGVAVSNTPGVLVEATADMAFGLLLSSARRIHEGWAYAKAGRWTKSLGQCGGDLGLGCDLYGKTLGIVGMGDIGSAAARRALASGMRIIYHNRRPRADEAKFEASYRSFDALLAEADFVLVLSPLTAQTRGMFNAEAFGKMKKGAYFINAARGPIVVTEDMVTALKSGQLAYAAMDVTDPEPLPVDHELYQMDNVLITPHIASAGRQTRAAMMNLAVDNLLAALHGQPMPTCLNPEVGA